MEKRDKVVYRHLKPNGEIFYIGIGYLSRAYSKHNRSQRWKNVVNKYDYKIEILQNNLTLDEAKDIEIMLIALYGRKDKNMGTLINMTDGGDGVTALPNEIRDKIRKSNIGKKHIFKSEQTLEKSKLTRFKLGSTINNKKVINTETGKIYESAKECHKIENLKISCGHLRDMMSGLKKNNTKFKYLEKMDKKLICCYGTLRLNQPNYQWLLTEAKHLGTINTQSIFELYSLDGFPGVKENGQTSIVVDIFEVSDYEATRVDSLEGYKEGNNNTFYDKIYIDTPFGKAAMYIYMGKVYEQNRIESGDWCEFIESKYITE